MKSERRTPLYNFLRVVQTQAILFLKSMSEWDGSDIERLRNWMMNFSIDSIPIEDEVIQIQFRSMSDPTLSDIDFKNKMVWVRTTLKLFHMNDRYQKWALLGWPCIFRHAKCAIYPRLIPNGLMKVAIRWSNRSWYHSMPHGTSHGNHFTFQVEMFLFLTNDSNNMDLIE